MGTYTTYLFTFIFMVVIAVCAAGISIRKHWRGNTKREIVWMFFQFLFFYMIVIHVDRCILLRGMEPGNYFTDSALIIADILAVCFAYFLINGICDYNLKSRLCVITAIVVYAIAVIYQYIGFNNWKSAVYEMMIPLKFLIAGGIAGIFWGMFFVLANHKTEMQRNEKTVPRQWIIFNYMITVLLYPFYETFMTNADEFSFAFSDIFLYICIFVFFTYVILYLFTVKNLKSSEVILQIIAAFSISSYIQGMFLNGKLFLMDGGNQEWQVGTLILNLLIWMVVFTVIFVVCRWKEKVGYGSLTFISVMLIFMQLTAGVSLIFTEQTVKEGTAGVMTDYFATTGIYEVASDKNVIVFILDTYDTDYLDQVLEEDENFLNPLKGFSYYPDMVSQFSRTFPSVPYLLTNEPYFYEKPYYEYCEDAYRNSDIWDQMYEKGYSLYFYLENQEFIGSDVRIKCSNYVDTAKVIDEKISFVGTVEGIVRISAFRIMPYLFKDYYRYTAEEIGTLVIEERILQEPDFKIDDAVFYEGLRREGLSVNDEEKAFRFYHLMGAHAPYTLTEDGRRVKEGKTTALEQYIGSMNIVYAYLEEMKRLDVYEDAMIIITADHGESFTTETLPTATNPILFIKQAGANGSQTIEYSKKPASQEDILATIAGETGVISKNPAGYNLLDEVANIQNRIRYHYYSVVEDSEQTGTKTYRIEGDSRDFTNWQDTQEYREFVYY